MEDDLAGKVTPSEINVNGALSMNGSYLTNVGAVQMIGGNAPVAAGSLYYDGGEFFAIDSTGVVQLTAAGSLNAGALGSIVGDYGGSNPARVTYNDASGEYRFTEDVGIWADLVADDVVLMGANGSVRLGVDPAITTARQLIIKSLPTSGTSFLVYNSATSTLEDGATTPVTALSVGTLAATTSFTAPVVTAGNLAYSGSFTHATVITQSLDLSPIAHTWLNNGAGGALTLAEADRLSANFFAGNSVRLPCPTLSPGDRVYSVVIGYTGHAPSAVNVVLDIGSSTPTLFSTTASSTYTVTTGGGVLLTYCKYTVSGSVGVPQYATATLAIPVAGNVSVKITAGGTPGTDTIRVYNVDINYDRVSVTLGTLT